MGQFPQAYVDKRAGERGGDVAGDTALHMAARAGFATGVMLLLTAGASPARTNSEVRSVAPLWNISNISSRPASSCAVLTPR